MPKAFLIAVQFWLLMSAKGFSQLPTASNISNSGYRHPSQDKQSWQRLYLWLSSTFIFTAKEGQVDLDSCLLIASRSLGLSRFSILAEGIGDTDLLAKSQWVDRRDPANAIHLLSQTTGKKHLETLVLLGAYYAFQPWNSNRHKDSSEYFLTAAINESKALKEERLGRQALCLLGKIYIQANDKKGDSAYNQLIIQCKAIGDKETEATVHAYRGIYMPLSPATALPKISDLQNAADLYQTLNNPAGEIYALTGIGYLLIVTGQLQRSYESFLKALQLAESIHYPYTHYNTDAIGMVKTFEGKFAEPLKYALQTIKIAENNRDSIGWGIFYDRLASLYNSEGRVKESLEMAYKAIDRFVIDRNPIVYNILIQVLNNMSHEDRLKEGLRLIQDISKKVNDPVTLADQFFYHAMFANCYTGLGMLELAEMHTAKMDSIETRAESFRGPLRRSQVDEQYAYIFMKRGQYQKAKEILEKHFKTYSPMQRSVLIDLNIYRTLIRIDSILGDNASGLIHYKKYTQLLDSSFRVTKIRQAEELQVLYQTEEKENQIALLNQQSKLEQANLKQATLVKNMTIAGIILLFVIAGLLYWQNRLRKKKNNVITDKNGQLQHLLTEKEWLLKEIHHRVKNNLQIVMSLLKSQARYIDNESALTAIHDSQHRVHAMSLIHQKLYNSDNVSTIDMELYIHELASYLGDSFNVGHRIRFEYFIEPLEMDVSQSVPLGLILNEAITNSLKYAFPGDRKGIITISLSNTTGTSWLLTVTDNGIGMSANFNNKKPGSLGMRLMKGLSEDLDGSFFIESKNGTAVKVSFEHDLSSKRHDTLASYISE